MQAYAASHKLKIARDVWDVSDEQPLAESTNFGALLSYVFGGGARVVLVESMARVAPDLATQVTASMLFEQSKIELVPVSQDWVAAKAQVMLQPKKVMFGDVVNTVLETNRVFATHGRLANLKKGRDKRSAELGYRVEGNPSWGRFPTETVEAARKLKAAGKSLRQISAELAKLGYLNNAAKPYGAESIARRLRGDPPSSKTRGGVRS